MCAWPGATAVDDKGNAANEAAMTLRQKKTVACLAGVDEGVWRWAGAQGSRRCSHVREEVALLPGMSPQRLQGYFASHSRVAEDLLVSWLSANSGLARVGFAGLSSVASLDLSHDVLCIPGCPRITAPE